MHWITASLLSAFFAGINDLSAKHAVQKNAVTPVLFHERQGGQKFLAVVGMLAGILLTILG